MVTPTAPGADCGFEAGGPVHVDGIAHDLRLLGDIVHIASSPFVVLRDSQVQVQYHAGTPSVRNMPMQLQDLFGSVEAGGAGCTSSRTGLG